MDASGGVFDVLHHRTGSWIPDHGPDHCKAARRRHTMQRSATPRGMNVSSPNFISKSLARATGRAAAELENLHHTLAAHCSNSGRPRCMFVAPFTSLKLHHTLGAHKFRGSARTSINSSNKFQSWGFGEERQTPDPELRIPPRGRLQLDPTASERREAAHPFSPVDSDPIRPILVSSLKD